MPEEERYVEEPQPEQQPIQIPAEWRKGKNLEILERLMRPDLAEDKEHYPEMTKELKVSNIKRMDMENVMDLSDLSIQWRRLKATDFADFLLRLRDIALSLTSSVDGFERAISQTEIREQRFTEEKKTGILQRVFKRKEETQ